MKLSHTDKLIVLLILFALDVILGLTLVHGLVTGAIDGPSSGKDLVVFEDKPHLFVLMAAFYAFWLLVFSWATVMLVKHRNAT